MEVELNNDGPVTITLESPLPQQQQDSKANASPKDTPKQQHAQKAAADSAESASENETSKS